MTTAAPPPTHVAPVFLELTYVNPHGDNFPMLFNASLLEAIRANGTTPAEGTVILHDNNRWLVAESYDTVKQMLEQL